MAVTCRAATPADADAVRRLATGFDGAPPQEGFGARYERVLRSEDWALLVAESGDELVGYALVQDYGPGLRRDLAVGRLHDLYVAPEHRRRGAGRLLMAAVTQWCRGRPVPMVLDWQSRLDAVPFYDSLGLVGDTTGDTATYPAYSIDFR